MGFNARAKVISWFIFAILLIVNVSAVTYFSAKKLLDTVQSLAAPSEKLTLLNTLLADIYQLHKVKGHSSDEGDSTGAIDYRVRIQDRLEHLKSLPTDRSEE